ncbi:unnamed protein product [Closterium sp. NIES-53]
MPLGIQNFLDLKFKTPFYKAFTASGSAAWISSECACGYVPASISSLQCNLRVASVISAVAVKEMVSQPVSSQSGHISREEREQAIGAVMRHVLFKHSSHPGVPISRDELNKVISAQLAGRRVTGLPGGRGEEGAAEGAGGMTGMREGEGEERRGGTVEEVGEEEEGEGV